MSDRTEGQTYYEILEVKPNAASSEIYSAYQRARSTYSPNSPALYSMFTPQEAQQLMALIEEAYQTLSHQARRRDYDLKIGVTKAAGNSGPAPSPAPFVSKSHSTPASVPSHAEPAKTTGFNWVGPVKVQTMKKKEDLPGGFGRTKFSVYEIKPELESEIATIEECDGLFLQKVRLYKGVSLEQLSEEIRVIKTTLVALEANDLEVLPVAVFTRGFVVQIARVLGLNERKISDAYMKYFRANKR